MQAARTNSLSVALFAQGWVYENQGKEHFTQNENRFWMLLHDLCVPHSSLNLPFFTTFCQGQGLNYYYNAKVISSLQPSHISQCQDYFLFSSPLLNLAILRKPPPTIVCISGQLFPVDCPSGFKSADWNVLCAFSEDKK